MERVREKLHSRTGASMLIALLFFLVAMVVGGVVLTAASTNAGRVERNRREQQNYLAVASAAELVKEDIAGEPAAAFTAAYRKTVVDTFYPAEYNELGELVSPSYTTRDTSYQFETGETYGAKMENSALMPGLLEELKRIYGDTLPPGVTGVPKLDVTTDVDLELAFGAEDMPAVAGSLAVSPADDGITGQRRYTLTVVLGAKPEQEGGLSPYATTLEFAPSVTKRVQPDTPVTVGDTTTYITHYITTVTWEEPVIRKGAQG